MTQALGLHPVCSLWEKGDGKAREAAIHGVKEKQTQPSPALLLWCLALSQPLPWWWGGTEKAGQAATPSILVIWCQFGLGLHFQLGDPKLCGMDPYQRGWLMSPGARQSR